jgi:hypothetical protein
MNQGGYFGAYQGGFKTLPNGAYEMMTAPTQQLASTITNLAGMAAGAYGAAKTGKAETAAFQQGAGPQYQNVESMSQAYGVPINSTLTEQYKNIGSMTSPQQQAAFQQSLAQEAQRIQAIGQLNYQRQQAAQSQGMQQLQRGVAAGLSTVPPINPQLYLPSGQGRLPSYNPLFGQ